MEDLTGLGKAVEGVAKLADSQLVVRSYDDLLSPGMKEAGKLLEDSTKAFRLFTAPLQLLAVAQDRLADFCEHVCNKVPRERQKEAQPSIALPILMSVRFIEDGNPLLQMFAELLAKSIDKDACGLVHPAFPRIIEQLSPQEARLLYDLKLNEKMFYGRQQNESIYLSYHSVRVHTLNGETLPYRTDIYSLIDHLKVLGICYDYGLPSTDARLPFLKFEGCNVTELSLTSFGLRLTQACIPEDIVFQESDQ